MKAPDEIYAEYIETQDGPLLVAHERPEHAGEWNTIVEVSVYKKTGTILVTNTTVVTKNPTAH